MFRLETRWILIITLVLIWTVPMYMLLKYSTDYNALRRSETELRHDLDIMKNELASIEEQLKFTHPNRIKYFKRETLDKQVADDLSTAVSRPPNLSESRPRAKNIFVEVNSDQLSNKQFFKISGSSRSELFKYVQKLPADKKKKILVTGGAGFVGSHLVDSLMLDGHEVIVCDNFHTGRKSNIEHWQDHPNFQLITHDVIDPLPLPKLSEIYHLASPASPVHYMANPLKTIKTNSIGSMNMLNLAQEVGARILIASTSEIYGDPEVHPQSETYWGHVNPFGLRSCYDESKRLSETLAMAYKMQYNVSIGIARIFNTYGPRMHPNDGRVVSNFIIQSINNQPMTVYGDGRQTRSFQYVTDLVLGLKKLMESRVDKPVNLGNPNELSISSLAEKIKNLVPNSSSSIVFDKLPADDPHRRRPDISRALKLLNWKPVVSLHDGLLRTVEYFVQELS